MQAAEARAMARQMVNVYAEFARNGAAMPVIAGAPSSFIPCLPSSHPPACVMTGGRASAAMPLIACALPDLPVLPPQPHHSTANWLPATSWAHACARHMGCVLGNACTACSKQ